MENKKKKLKEDLGKLDQSNKYQISKTTMIKSKYDCVPMKIGDVIGETFSIFQFRQSPKLL